MSPRHRLRTGSPGERGNATRAPRSLLKTRKGRRSRLTVAALSVCQIMRSKLKTLQRSRAELLKGFQQLLLFRRCFPNNHIWNSVPGFNGMELIYRYPDRTVRGSRQSKKQQRLWREQDNRALYYTGISPVFKILNIFSTSKIVPVKII